MSGRRLYDKVMTIVGTLMIFFYFGLAYIILFSSIINADKTLIFKDLILCKYTKI